MTRLISSFKFKNLSGGGGGDGWWANPLQTLSQGLVLSLRFTFDPELDNTTFTIHGVTHNVPSFLATFLVTIGTTIQSLEAGTPWGRLRMVCTARIL